MNEKKELALTAKHLDVLKHSLGIDYAKQKIIDDFKEKKESYRNRFCAGEGHADYPILKSLCDMEIMDHSAPQESLGGDMYFYVTDKGIKELIKFL